MMLRSLSIVMPAHGPAGQLPALVAECLAVAARHAADYELLLVVDGSDVAVQAEAARLASTHAAVVALPRRPRQGFRHALREAWGLARGELVAWVDPAQIGPGALPRLLAVADGYAAVFGARAPAAPRGARRRLLPGAPLRDPELRLGLARAELRDLVGPEGRDGAVAAELATGARRRGLTVTEVEVAPRRAGRPRGGPRQTLGLGALVAAGCLWLLRRWRPAPRR